MLTSIIAAVVILGLLILVHEVGHFTMAKRLGVRVVRFSIGYPPKLVGLRRGETEYVIGATPLGGYVRMLGDEVGDDPKTEELDNYLREIGFDLIGAAAQKGSQPRAGSPDDDLLALANRMKPDSGEPIARGQAQAIALAARDLKSEETAVLGRELKPEEIALVSAVLSTGSAEAARKMLCKNPPAALLESFNQRSFPTQPLSKRVLIILAGPLSNILFAPVMLTLLFMYGVPTVLPILGEVKQGMPAFQAGLRGGDRVVAIQGRPLESWADLSSSVKASEGRSLKIEVERGANQRTEIVVRPVLEEQKTPYGTTASAWVIGVMPRGDEIVRRLDPFRATWQGVFESCRMTGELVTGIAQIVSGATPVRQAIGGPIMIAQLAGREAHQGLVSGAMFTVMLSIELGIINLLPVPLLDGGHLLFFIFEGIRGEPLPLRHREIALQIGLFLVVALMAFAIFNDISRIVQG
ncbi:MAG TPA: RIP metalloprotease RseP [Candidatus Binataceae bacterium]|nr:RIP metalloprotease RseP [Candidatus Binataceae bacterium]